MLVLEVYVVPQALEVPKLVDDQWTRDPSPHPDPPLVFVGSDPLISSLCLCAEVVVRDRVRQVKQEVFALAFGPIRRAIETLDSPVALFGAGEVLLGVLPKPADADGCARAW